MDTYETYKLIDWDWIQVYKTRMGKEAFQQYVNDVYRLLLTMLPGKPFNIEEKVREENRELFIKIVCMFISEGNGNYGFSDDYKKVRYEGEIKTKKKELDTGGEGDPPGEPTQENTEGDSTNAEPATELGKSIHPLQSAGRK